MTAAPVADWSDDDLRREEAATSAEIAALEAQIDALRGEIADRLTAVEPVRAERHRRAREQYRREWASERLVVLIQTALTAPPGTYHPDTAETLIVAFEEDYG